MTYQAKAQDYRLIVGNKSECDIHIKTTDCDDNPGPDFLVHSNDQVEVNHNKKYKEVSAVALLSSGDVLVYKLTSTVSPNGCGNVFLPVLYPNGCINSQYNHVDNGILRIGLWQ